MLGRRWSFLNSWAFWDTRPGWLLKCSLSSIDGRIPTFGSTDSRRAGMAERDRGFEFAAKAAKLNNSWKWLRALFTTVINSALSFNSSVMSSDVLLAANAKTRVMNSVAAFSFQDATKHLMAILHIPRNPLWEVRGEESMHSRSESMPWSGPERSCCLEGVSLWARTVGCPTLDTVRMISNSEAERKLTSWNFKFKVWLFVAINDERIEPVCLAPSVDGTFCLDAADGVIRHPVPGEFGEVCFAFALVAPWRTSLGCTPRGPWAEVGKCFCLGCCCSLVDLIFVSSDIVLRTQEGILSKHVKGSSSRIWGTLLIVQFDIGVTKFLREQPADVRCSRQPKSLFPVQRRESFQPWMSEQVGVSEAHRVAVMT